MRGAAAPGTASLRWAPGEGRHCPGSGHGARGLLRGFGHRKELPAAVGGHAVLEERVSPARPARLPGQSVGWGLFLSFGAFGTLQVTASHP